MTEQTIVKLHWLNKQLWNYNDWTNNCKITMTEQTIVKLHWLNKQL
jgi:hypothetical protein